MSEPVTTSVSIDLRSPAAAVNTAAAFGADPLPADDAAALAWLADLEARLDRAAFPVVGSRLPLLPGVGAG
jgi:hypothetical protein